ncbi:MULTISPECIES: adenine deaminase [Bacillaceae]|uniref:adenine deaminase n=1 Tax=Bacillaceae TaxID=186817 RepID=UPI000660697E|nr:MULTISPECIES: adenine deaminase [Bacillaceae]MCF7622790.1 adenine deaminase [Peribacillus frigoritolerans]PRA91405.1 adenine deaminase [Peribacillus simplex]
MNMKKNLLKRRIDVATGRTPADCVIKNGQIIDVFNGDIYTGDIAIADGYFAGIGRYEGTSEIDAAGKFVCPSFIDGHVHIESSMVRPYELAKILLLHGVTCIVADPHEIANVSGKKGMEYMIEQSDQLPFDFYFMMPSCVPATEFEHSGAVLRSEDLISFYQNPRVLGLAEIMNFPAVSHTDEDMLQKIYDANRLGKSIDGHAAGLSEQQLDVYLSAGIKTDHECTTAEEAKERLRKGMYLMIREGTVAKDLINLIPVINEKNSRRCLFVTDDRHLDDIVSEGSIDHNVRLSIETGVPPITAIQMATINAAECFGLKEHGAIAPGYKADFLLLDDLDSVILHSVFKDGKLMVQNNRLLNYPADEKQVITDGLKHSVQFHEITGDDFAIPIKNEFANIIEITPNSLITKHSIEPVTLNHDGLLFQFSEHVDHLKLAVIERHHMTKQVGLGIVKGLGLKSGAIATTVAHDSHNLIIAGTNDQDMLLAAKEIKKMQGGLTVIQNGKILASLPLPIAGLMSECNYMDVVHSLKHIDEALLKLGSNRHFNPFLTLAFLALPVIPEIKLTDQGLFSVSEFRHIPLEASKPVDLN